MPKLNRRLIRAWLEEHNWTVRRLAEECSAIGEDKFPEGTVRNAVNGIDPMRPGRIRVICKVLAKYGDGVPYAQLIDNTTGDAAAPEPQGTPELPACAGCLNHVWPRRAD